MALGYLDDGKLTAIADSIRSKTGKSATMTVDEMPDEIEAIETGGEIGPFYDGVSHFVIAVPRADYEVTIQAYCNNAGDVTISWGDGSSEGWPIAGRTSVSHTYATPGMYDITFPHDSETMIELGGSTLSYCVFGALGTNDKTFRQITMLRYAEISNGDKLNGYCFYNCTALEKVVIDKAFWTTGDYVFRGCYNLKSVVGLENIISPIGDGYFYSCTALPEVPQASIRAVVQNSQFYGCHSLATVEIPSTVTEIKAAAFRYCTDLQYVRLISEKPPKLGNVNAFGNSNGYPIYVPAAAVDAYKAASVWSGLADRIMADPEG